MNQNRKKERDERKEKYKEQQLMIEGGKEGWREGHMLKKDVKNAK